MKIIEVEHLKKYFGEIKAVDDISFSVNEGEFFAFLGLNGAGKSTTINIITGTLVKDFGYVRVNGGDIDKDALKIKSEIGVVFQNSVLDKHLSVYENLKFRGQLYSLKGRELKSRIEYLAKALDFEKFLKRSVKTLSGGQRRKVDVARALINSPRILILDEPTTGLDPKTRRELWHFLNELRQTENTTVFLTTHYMEETAAADNVVIIDEGKIIACDSPVHLKEQFSGDYIRLYKENLDSAAFNKLSFEEELKISEENEFYLIEIATPAQATELICKYPAVFLNYELYKGDMDDVFLNATGKKIREAV
jgi:multidrug/hemolysin transport system ATP-binding protein